MLDGRVKTLHPAVHGGILARRSRPDDLAAIDRHGITPDRPRRRQPVSVRARGGRSRDALRRAGRGDRHRRAEPRAGGREELPRRARGGVARRLSRGRRRSSIAPGGPSLEFRFALARKAFAHTAEYDAAIAARTRTGSGGRDGAFDADRRRGRACRPPVRLGPRRPSTCATARTRTRRPPGTAARRTTAGSTVHAGQGTVVHQPARPRLGRARSRWEFDEPAAVVIKHTNPCGAATGAVAGRGLRPRARRRPAVGLRRHRRPESCRSTSRRRGRSRRRSSRR